MYRGVEALEVFSVFLFAYLSYITADLVGWSGIISLTGNLYIYMPKPPGYLLFACKIPFSLWFWLKIY
jgi:hypothetical protein